MTMKPFIVSTVVVEPHLRIAACRYNICTFLMAPHDVHVSISHLSSMHFYPVAFNQRPFSDVNIGVLHDQIEKVA